MLCLSKCEYSQAHNWGVQLVLCRPKTLTTRASLGIVTQPHCIIPDYYCCQVAATRRSNGHFFPDILDIAAFIYLYLCPLASLQLYSLYMKSGCDILTILFLVGVCPVRCDCFYILTLFLLLSDGSDLTKYTTASGCGSQGKTARWTTRLGQKGG